MIKKKSNKSPETLKKLRFSHTLTLLGYFSLLIILMINIAWLLPSQHFPIALVLLVIAGPLLFPMRGLLNNNIYTYQWASFLSLPYFAHGITEISAHPHMWYLGASETMAAFIMYLGCVLYARIFKIESKKRAKEKLRQEARR
jgi:uncharacterized membrane protein